MIAIPRQKSRSVRSHEEEREVVKREVTEEDVGNVCPNCSIGFVCCPGVNASTCCEQVRECLLSKTVSIISNISQWHPENNKL